MAPEQDRKPDIDALVAELRGKVAERRRNGDYPAGLEDALSAHFQRIVRNRIERQSPNLREPMQRLNEALPLNRERIPVESHVPAGEVVHRAVARLVARQTQGVLEQVQAFAEPTHDVLQSLVAAVEGLTRELRVEVGQHLDAIYERLASQEREILLRQVGGDGVTRATGPKVTVRRPVLDPWYSQSRFDDEFRGSREEVMERYRELATQLVGYSPLLDLGCGRGELVEFLGKLGVEARGIDLDPELVKIATDRGLPVELGDGLRYLERLENASLGGLLCIQVVEHLDTQDLVDLVALAAERVRPQGRVFVETVNPQSLYVFARSFYVDPTHLRPVHPAFLTFLFREAGFSSVEIDWRSPPPRDEVLEELSEVTPLSSEINANVRRLNQLIFAPQDYMLVAVR